MTTERNSTAADGQPLPVNGSTIEEPSHDAESGHDNVVRMAFRERPYHDEMLMKTHPSKVYFDAFVLHPVPGGFMPVLVSSVLVDKAIRH